MKTSCILFIFLMSVISIFAQETITGTYSYTYGDSESLVDARKTCKELAIRDAIESYHIFITSETVVDNFQLKSDVITSISGGNLKNILITEQMEEDRTITISITAEIDPEDVKTVINEMAAELKNKEVADSATTNTGLIFLNALEKYKDNMKNYDKNLSRGGGYDELGELLKKYTPDKQDRFQWLLHQSLQKRIDIAKGLKTLQTLESKNRRILARAQLKKINLAAVELNKIITDLEKIKLNQTRFKLIRSHWISRCRQTLNIVRKKNVSLGKK